MNGLDWLAQFLPGVKALCRKINADHADDLLDVAIDKVNAIYDTYDEGYGTTLYTHMMRNLRWYFYKWWVKYSKHTNTHMTVQHKRTNNSETPGMVSVDHHKELWHHDRPWLDNEELVNYILERLDEDDRALLIMHIVDGLTGEEIGDLLGICRSGANQRCARALNRARDICRSLMAEEQRESEA